MQTAEEKLARLIQIERRDWLADLFCLKNERAALLRASLDLTNALADLRQGR